MNLYLAAVFTNNYMEGQPRAKELNEVEAKVFEDIPTYSKAIIT